MEQSSDETTPGSGLKRQTPLRRSFKTEEYIVLQRPVSANLPKSNIASLKTRFESKSVANISDISESDANQSNVKEDSAEEYLKAKLEAQQVLKDINELQTDVDNKTNIDDGAADVIDSTISNEAEAEPSDDVKLRRRISLPLSAPERPDLKKRVSFSSTISEVPTPAPRTSLQPRPVTPFEVVRVESLRVEKEVAVPVIIKTKSDVNSNYIPKKSRIPKKLAAPKKISYAEPEPRHIISRASSEDSVDKIASDLDSFIMDGKPKEKKRSNSFRRILRGGFFGKEKKKEDDRKKTKKTENAVIDDNAQNEFNRNSTTRHTTDSQFMKTQREAQPRYQTQNATGELEHRYAQMHINRYNHIKSNFAQGIDPSKCSEDYVCMNSGAKPEPQNYINVSGVKYIDTTSSSSNTLDSENLTFDGSLRGYQSRDSANSNYSVDKPLNNSSVMRAKFFERGPSLSPERYAETPPRAFDTHQNVQLVKPKAIIPINSERPLPNPYQDKPPPPPNVKTIERNLNMGSGKDAPMKQYDDFSDGVYGTVYDRRLLRPKPSSPEQFSPKTHSSGTSSPTSNPRMSPRSPSLEGSKLRLPVHREKVDLQPRIKSPIPSNMVSTDKIIATELLKKRKDEKRTSPSHQRLEIEIDYPGADLPKLPTMPPIGKPPMSPKGVPNLEAGEWHKRQRDLNSSPSIPLQVTTNVMVHVDSQSPQNRSMTPSQELHSRSITPVTIRSQSSTLSLQRTPPKHEIRQTVEAFCWKELKKMKEKEDRELQMKLQLTPYGYAEDPVISHRSRSMSPNLARNTRRSASLPREIERQRRLEATNAARNRQPPNLQNQSYGQLQGTAMYNPNFTWKSPQRNTVDGPRNGYDTSQRPIFKRGSLTQQNSYDTQIYNKKVSFHSPQNAQNPWPTKNGFTQSPPQRRPEFRKESVLEDDVFAPETPKADVVDKGKEPIYGSNTKNVALYGDAKTSGVENKGNEPLYATNNSRDVNKGRDVNYGHNQQVYGENKIREPIYATKANPNNNQSPLTREEIFYRNQLQQRQMKQAYGSRSEINGEPPYLMKQDQMFGSRSVINEPIYGMRNPQTGELVYTRNGEYQQQQIYGTRKVPNGEPLYAQRPNQMREPIYGTRPMPNIREIEPTYTTRPKVVNEPIYGQREMYPPQNNSQGGRYDYPPEESPYSSRSQISPQYVNRNPTYGDAESLYGRTGVPRQPTVNNRVCDMYGRIHDSSDPRVMSPPPQRSGVLYGQLHRNSNAPPMQYQSYNQIQNSNFVRGSRLTASANDMYRRYQPNQAEPPNRPLPPIPSQSKTKFLLRRKQSMNTDGGSVTNEVHKIYQEQPTNRRIIEEEWNSDGKSGRGLSGNDSGNIRSETDGDLRSRSRNNRRDDPRRHTLAGEQYGTMSGQGGPLSRTMDLEGQPRGYPPPSNAMLFDDDPGIMSEVETSSTGFRRGGKQRSSLPVVRTPSKTLERPLGCFGFHVLEPNWSDQSNNEREIWRWLENPGLVFLQYRNETKRALLPNEITSIDTVKALFVRSFPKQLTMEYLDSPQVKIYIHDSSKDMFYELEDLRSHLREIRDRSVLRLFESADVSGGLPMAGIGIAGGVGHFEDPSYFSEPEFDSEYQHQHIHKSKGSTTKSAPYYIGSTASLPRGGLLRYSPAVGNIPQDRMKTLPTGAPPKPQRAYSSGTNRSSDGARAPDRFAQFQRPNNSLFNIPDGYMSSPERGSRYEDPYYSQYGTRSGSITPVIDEEVSDTELLDEQYSLYGVKIPQGGPRPAPRTQFSTPAAPPYDATRIRVEHMERQLANLTGLVQKALTQTPATLQVPSGRDSYRGDDFDKNSTSSSQSLPDDTFVRSETKTPKLGKSGCHKSVSFEKSVSFSDEPPDMNSPKQHSPQHSADTKPTKPAIKSSTLPRTSSQERDRLKPAPPPKPASLSPGQYDGRHIYRDLQLTPEMYNQLRGLQKKAKDLRAEVRNLRRMSQAQAHSVRETIRDTFIKIRAMLLVGGEQVWQAGMDQERTRLSREEDLYKQEMIRLETDLSDLESTVEELRGNVINRKTRVNMSDVENMALVLSKSSKTVADLKLRFPLLQDGMKTMLSTEMEKVVREEKFLKEEPERLESALRRCKKLTGTLVTLKRLASVQEQRLPCSATSTDGHISPTEAPPITPTSAQHSKPPAGARVGAVGVGGDTSNASDGHQRPENALDALLDELQTFSKPHTVNTQIPQVCYTESEPPTLPVKGIAPSHSSHFSHPITMQEIGRKGSMDSATILPTQNLTVSTATGSLRRLHSYPSGSDTDNSPPIQPIQRVQVDSKSSGKPPIPERNAELLQHISTKRVPPPPPPRTSSKSPLASPTSPSLPPRSPATNLQHIQNVQNMVENKPLSQFETATQNLGFGTLRRNMQNRSSLKDRAQTLPRNIGSNLQVHTQEGENAISASNSSSCESVNSQDGTKKRKEELEQRHQELLKKQKALQEQYARLQQLQRGNHTLAVIPPAPDQLLKKTGSESNILQKMGLQLSTSQITGSLTNLPNQTLKNATATLTNNAANVAASQQNNNTSTGDDTSTSSNTSSTTNKVYETDIL